MPEFPGEAQTVLLTECAAFDPTIVDKIKKQLMDGKSVVITSGLLRALQGKGIEDIAEIRYTDRKAIIKGFRGQANISPDLHILIPQIQYLTNDVWELVSGMTQNDLGYPLLLQAGYGKGTLYVLTIPENFSDLYSFPAPILTQIRNVLLRDLFVRIESPGDVSLFVYDNDTFIVESFLSECRRCPDFDGSAVYQNPGTDDGAGIFRSIEPGSRRLRRFWHERRQTPFLSIDHQSSLLSRLLRQRIAKTPRIPRINRYLKIREIREIRGVFAFLV